MLIYFDPPRITFTAIWHTFVHNNWINRFLSGALIGQLSCSMSLTPTQKPKYQLFLIYLRLVNIVYLEIASTTQFACAKKICAMSMDWQTPPHQPLWPWPPQTWQCLAGTEWRATTQLIQKHGNNKYVVQWSQPVWSFIMMMGSPWPTVMTLGK